MNSSTSFYYIYLHISLNKKTLHSFFILSHFLKSVSTILLPHSCIRCLKKWIYSKKSLSLSAMYLRFSQRLKSFRSILSLFLRNIILWNFWLIVRTCSTLKHCILAFRSSSFMNKYSISASSTGFLALLIIAIWIVFWN